MRLLKKAVAYVCAVSMVAGVLAVTPADSAKAAKKPVIAKKTYNVTVGKTVTIKVKNSVKKSKIKWKFSKKGAIKLVKSKNGKNAYAKVKALKAGKVKVTAKYQYKKNKKNMTCNVVVKKAESKATAKPTATAAAAVPTATAAPTAAPTPADPFTIIKDQKADAMMYIDKSDSEYDGISLIAEAFKADVARVIGVGTDEEGTANESPNGLQVVTDANALSGKAIIAGTIGANGNSVINKLVSEGKIDVSGITGKWECYKMQVVKNPMPNVSEALVIAGSDKRGTIYGIFRVSELMGVSPWVWWADATPEVKANIVLDGKDVNVTSKEPSVKYRGIFLNDEDPSLTNWTDGRYKGRNHLFYRQVFELILRLKGDYLWPAMWGNEFSKDGTDGGASDDTLANAKLADQYGVVMGTSHHEPLYRAGNEWGQEYSKYKGSLSLGSAQAWNKYNVPGEDGYDEKINTAIEKFWRDGVKRNGQFDNICTVGMRGEADSELPAAGDPPKYAELLNHIINTQKQILTEEADVNPTQLVVYKEVEDAWNKGQLYEQDCMKDTIAMMCDDNWAYLRTLPTYEQQQMVGGLGMYYHFDYVGAPKSYTWIQTTQLSRIWDQMSVAYDYNIDDVWVVNVGDLKPMEMDISYFIDLGYDFEKWGANGSDKISEYQLQWVKQQLGSGLKDEQVKEASRLISDYLDLETSRKVEHVLYNTADTCSDMFSVDNYSEAQNLLMKCNDIMARAQKLMDETPESVKAAMYQLVYYPAMAVPNVLKIQIYAALNNKYANMNLAVANVYKELCQEAIAFDAEIYDKFNNAMPGGPENGKKWQGMQSADQKYHIGMEKWNTDSGKLPVLKDVQTTDGAGKGMAVLVEGITGSFKTVYTEGEAKLPAFTSVNNEVYTIELSNTSSAAYNYTASPSADWIVLDKKEGKVAEFDSINVTVDWSKVTANTTGTVVISDGTNSVTVNVSANVINVTGLENKTYVMANNYAAIDVANYTAVMNGSGLSNDGTTIANGMVVVPDNGKYMSSVRTTASTVTYNTEADLKNAPYVEYKVYVPEDGTYNIDCQFNPTSNLQYDNMQLRYAISVDGGATVINNSIVNDYLAGTWKQGTWATDIEKNGRKSTVSGISLTAGTHTIRYYQCDPNMALIRMIVYKGNLATVYNAPAESYYVGKNVDVNARISDKKNMYSVVTK